MMETQTRDGAASRGFHLGPLALSAAGGSLLTAAILIGAGQLQGHAAAADPLSTSTQAAPPAAAAAPAPAGAIAEILPESAGPAVVELRRARRQRQRARNRRW